MENDRKIKDYKDLHIWQKGIEIVDKIYSITERFPQNELYGLTSQMRKVAVSIPSNIAEGFVRKTYQRVFLFPFHIARILCRDRYTDHNRNK